MFIKHILGKFFSWFLFLLFADFLINTWVGKTFNSAGKVTVLDRFAAVVYRRICVHFIFNSRTSILVSSSNFMGQVSHFFILQRRAQKKKKNKFILSMEATLIFLFDSRGKNGLIPIGMGPSVPCRNFP